MESSVTGLQSKSVRRVLIYLVKISATNRSLIKTDLPPGILVCLLMAGAAQEELRRLESRLSNVKTLSLRVDTRRPAVSKWAGHNNNNDNLHKKPDEVQ